MLVNMLIHYFEKNCIANRFKLAFKGTSGFKQLKNKNYKPHQKGLSRPPPHVINEGMAKEDYEKFKAKKKKQDKAASII